MRIATRTLCLLALILPLTACTPEKAEALLAAVKAFEAKSSEALDAYEAMFRDYGAVAATSQDELFQGAYAAARQGQAGSFDDAVGNVGARDGVGIQGGIAREFGDIRAAYAALGSAYDSLPQGSVLGARYVSCGRNAVARLTWQLVNFADDVNQQPLYPSALRQRFAEFKRSAAQGDQGLARRDFDAFAGGVAAYEARHAAAQRLTLAAVEQGRRLDAMLAHYDDVSLSNLLGAIQAGFAFAGTLKGVDPSAAASRLQAVKTEMEGSAYWQRVGALPLADIAACAAPGKEQ
ncbi:hypothetical protein [Chitiniphilus shinanonensis]|uniref:hypothetical protein n=1 Tax=Chitiniphilus shinanonensis TaxID=553088 RepID=UPI0030693FE5